MSSNDLGTRTYLLFPYSDSPCTCQGGVVVLSSVLCSSLRSSNQLPRSYVCVKRILTKVKVTSLLLEVDSHSFPFLNNLQIPVSSFTVLNNSSYCLILHPKTHYGSQGNPITITYISFGWIPTRYTRRSIQVEEPTIVPLTPLNLNGYPQKKRTSIIPSFLHVPLTPVNVHLLILLITPFTVTNPRSRSLLLFHHPSYLTHRTTSVL